MSSSGRKQLGEDADDFVDVADDLVGHKAVKTLVKKLKDINLPELLKDVEEETNQLESYTTVQNLKQHEKEIEHLRKDLQFANSECKRLRKERNGWKSAAEKHGHERSRSSEADHERIKQVIDNKEKEVNRKIENYEKKLKDKEETSDAVIKEQDQKIQELKMEVKKRNQMIEQEKELREKQKFGFVDSKQHKEELDECQRQLQAKTDELTKVKLDLIETKEKLDDTSTRLSRCMGDKLTDKNPNIADLSDKNRPTKLSERYQELYDNQWTDAFEKLDLYYKDEETTVKTLVAILKETKEFCEKAAAKQMKELQKSLVLTEYESQSEIPDIVKKQLKDYRKYMSETSGKNLFKTYKDHLYKSFSDKSNKALSILPFVEECFSICWFMMVQDPPLSFGHDAKPGDILNGNIYKEYTSRGSRLQFVVWPALYLHEDGPLLCKGVAQGNGDTLPKKPNHSDQEAAGNGRSQRNDRLRPQRFLDNDDTYSRHKTFEVPSQTVRTDRLATMTTDFRRTERDNYRHVDRTPRFAWADETETARQDKWDVRPCRQVPTNVDIRQFLDYLKRFGHIRARAMMPLKYDMCATYVRDRHGFI